MARPRRQQRHTLFAQRGQITANAPNDLRTRTAAEAPGDLLLHTGPCADRAPPNCYQNPRGGLPGRAEPTADICAAAPADCGRNTIVAPACASACGYSRSPLVSRSRKRALVICLVGGGGAYFKYYVHRLFLSQSRALSWRAVLLLEEETGSILLQRVGGGY